LTALALSKIEKAGSTIRFEIPMSDRVMKYRLQVTSNGGRLFREGEQGDREGVPLKVAKSLLK
jgi:hypothetical protein